MPRKLPRSHRPNFTAYSTKSGAGSRRLLRRAEDQRVRQRLREPNPKRKELVRVLARRARCHGGREKEGRATLQARDEMKAAFYEGRDLEERARSDRDADAGDV